MRLQNPRPVGRPLVGQDLVAEGDAEVADVDVGWAGDEANVSLSFPAEGAAGHRAVHDADYLKAVL
jgi:hypothetical protein